MTTTAILELEDSILDLIIDLDTEEALDLLESLRVRVLDRARILTEYEAKTL
jgi:hypothetical protein